MSRRPNLRLSRLLSLSMAVAMFAGPALAGAESFTAKTIGLRPLKWFAKGRLDATDNLLLAGDIVTGGITVAVEKQDGGGGTTQVQSFTFAPEKCAVTARGTVRCKDIDAGRTKLRLIESRSTQGLYKVRFQSKDTGAITLPLLSETPLVVRVTTVGGLDVSGDANECKRVADRKVNCRNPLF